MRRRAVLLVGIVVLVGGLAVRADRVDAAAEARAAAWRRVEARLAAAERDDVARRDAALARLDEFFARARERTPAFAERVLSWESKWEFILSRFEGDERYARYLERVFAETVFPPRELVELLSRATREYLEGQRAREERLLLEVRADADGLPAFALPALCRTSRLRRAHEAAVRAAVRRELTHERLVFLIAMRLDRKEVRQTGEDVAEQVMLSLGTRLGTTAVLLGASVATAKATFGLSFVAAAILDQLVTWILDLIVDQGGKVVEEVNASLDRIHAQLASSTGLRGELERAAAERARVRRQAWRAVVFGVR